MLICKNCGSTDIIEIKNGIDINSKDKVKLSEIYLCPECLIVSYDLEDITIEE